MTPPGAALKPKLTLVPGVDPGQSETPTESAEPSAQPPESIKQDTKAALTLIRLRLKVCLRNLPAFQIKGELPEIADDEMVELPYSIVEPQLASGRVAIDPKVFQQAVPEKFRDLFVVDPTETPVLLPLQEVLQHLPGEALKMRQDQEHEEAIDHFETPFSFHAKEDRKRFGEKKESATEEQAAASPDPAGLTDAPDVAGVSPSIEAATSDQADESAKAAVSDDQAKRPVAEAETVASQDQPASPPPATVGEEKPVASGEVDKPAPTAEATSNAKEFVLRASCLPGVAACSIGFADGLTMAGNFPPGVGADGLCAMAPSLLQKIEKHMLETNLGELTSMTLHCSKTPLSFFMEGSICLTVLHAEKQLEPVTQEQLAEMTRELAQIFAQPEAPHVDH
jgi:predicted regulator of Ras-like GTPase activity (Roadblock/LC7/MglB family)